MNRNNIKISYRCMPNVKCEIARHNSKVLKKPEAEKAQPGCNCRDKTKSCPLDGKCLTDRVVYKATVEEPSGVVNTYTGVTKNTFKKRFYGHTNSFKNRNLEHSTTLSTHIWKLTDSSTPYSIRWSVIDRGKPFNPTYKKCSLCLNEKFHIIFQPAGSTLNSRSELFSTCRHRRDKLLCNI